MPTGSYDKRVLRVTLFLICKGFPGAASHKIDGKKLLKQFDDLIGQLNPVCKPAGTGCQQSLSYLALNALEGELPNLSDFLCVDRPEFTRKIGGGEDVRGPPDFLLTVNKRDMRTEDISLEFDLRAGLFVSLAERPFFKILPGPQAAAGSPVNPFGMHILPNRYEIGPLKYKEGDIVSSVILHTVDQQLEFRPNQRLMEMGDFGLAIFGFELDQYVAGYVHGIVKLRTIDYKVSNEDDWRLRRKTTETFAPFGSGF